MLESILAIDLGGTRVRFAQFGSPSGPPVRVAREATEAERGREHVISRIVASARRLIDQSPRAHWRAGVSAPGPLDPATGALISPPNLPGWEGETPLRAILEQRLGIPVAIGNDANLAALAEHRIGIGQGLGSLVYLTISTGIGGGVVLDGDLLLGAHGLAGEIGHMVIVDDGPACKCGGRGCLETLASGTAIARIAGERLQNGVRSVLSTFETITAEQVALAAAAGDRLAADVFFQAASHLGIGVVNVLHLFDPEIVVLGGGVVRAGELLFEPVRSVVRERALPGFRDRARIVPTLLGDDAGLYGAAILASRLPEARFPD